MSKNIKNLSFITGALSVNHLYAPQFYAQSGTAGLALQFLSYCHFGFYLRKFPLSPFFKMFEFFFQNKSCSIISPDAPDWSGIQHKVIFYLNIFNFFSFFLF